jgi:hypothetical protein
MPHTRLQPHTPGPMAHRARHGSRTRRITTVLLAGAMVIGLGAGTALASGGSAYVTSACDYPSLQDNTIVQGDDVYVWLKVTGKGVGDLTWTTVDSPSGDIQDGDLVLVTCENSTDKYQLYLADGFDSSTLGSYNLTVWSNGVTSVSSDGFRVVAPEA